MSDPIADFLFEAGTLKRTPRSGWDFLPGAGGESVAEHSFRVAVIAWTLARLSDEGADPARTVEMALLHDLAEARTGDLNYVHQRYVTADEERAWRDLAARLPFGGALLDLHREFEEHATPASRLAHDADQLEMLLSLVELRDAGNAAAGEWIPHVVARLRTDAARSLADGVLAGHASDWWFDRGSDWWVRRQAGEQEDGGDR